MSTTPQPSINRYRYKSISPSIKYLIRRYLLCPTFQIISYLTFLLSYLPWFANRTLQKPIFIIGCSRSGTTLFGDMFAQHEALADWSEAGFLFEPNYYARRIDHVKTANDCTEFHRRRLRTILGIYIWFRGKQRYVNHHPQNSLRIPFLKQIFPDAIFIHIIRDGRAVVRSNYGQFTHERFRQNEPYGYFPKPPMWSTYESLSLELQLSHQWVGILEHVETISAQTLCEESYIEIYYEEFCANPHATLRELDCHLGLSSEERHFDRIPKKFDLQNFKWKTDFSQKQLVDISSIIETLLTKHGYV